MSTSKTVEPSPLITPRTTQGLVIAEVVGEAASIGVVSKFESQQSRVWSSPKCAFQDEQSKVGASCEQDEEAYVANSHDGMAFDEEKGQKSPSINVKETEESEQARTKKVPALTLAL